jgi:hydroxyacylglutathione hydrolase
MPQSTLGYERLFNWALVENNEERFVEEVLAGQPEPPAYFARMKHVNRAGPGDSPHDIPARIDAARIAGAIATGETVVDTRQAKDFAMYHARATINIPRNKSFLTWAGALLPYDKDLVFLGDASESGRKSLMSDLALIGIERIAGVFPEESISDVIAAGVESASLSDAGVGDIASNGGANILDVRSRAEYAGGHIPQAINIPLGELPGRLSEVPNGRVVVHCQGGSRSAIAASILQQSGRDDVSNFTGGFTDWEQAGNAVERGNGGS